jgi:hypothetical protein
VSDDTALSISFYGIGGQGDVNGIQIEATEAVPEPGNTILLGVGGIFVLGFLKMRRNENTVFNA